MNLVDFLCRWRFFAGAERGTCVLQCVLDLRCERVRATEHAPRGPFYILESLHGLAEIVELGAVVTVERTCIRRSHCERDIMILPENASRHGCHF